MAGIHTVLIFYSSITQSANVHSGEEPPHHTTECWSSDLMATSSVTICPSKSIRRGTRSTHGKGTSCHRVTHHRVTSIPKQETLGCFCAEFFPLSRKWVKCWGFCAYRKEKKIVFYLHSMAEFKSLSWVLSSTLLWGHCACPSKSHPHPFFSITLSRWNKQRDPSTIIFFILN